MSFRQINRHKAAKLPFYSTKSMGLRIASQPHGSGTVTLIWIGCDLAAKVGLVGDRHLVDFLFDDSNPEKLRAAIRLNDESGQYCASRRYRDIAVYLDISTSKDCFHNNWFHDHVDPASIVINGSLLEFGVPALRPRPEGAA